jgi:hypothetical protein
MANQIHYEVFRRAGAKGGWTMHDVRNSRDDAIQMAQDLMAGEKATGVKVVKETYNDDTGDFMSLKIFEEGHNQVKVDVKAEDAPHALPCFKPDDLYSYHARATIARLLSDFLARCKITVTELIHRGDMLEKLEATGTLYQHAIQKIAVAQAASTNISVQQIVKSLNELTTQAIQKVYRDERKGAFPDPSAEHFAPLAIKLAANPDSQYLFNGALARYLSSTNGWDEKIQRLLKLMDHAPEDAGAKKLLLSAVDSIIAEILGGSAALHDLMGKSENLAGALKNLVSLFLGKTPEGAREGLDGLSLHFAKDDLPAAKTAIASRIIAEIKSNRRLCPESMVEELKSLRGIANSLVMGVGKYLSHEDLVSGFTLRSRRLVAQEALGQYIAEAAQDEKLERILFVEENIIGVENKRQLSSYIAPVLNSAAFEGHFHNAKLPLLSRLQRLAQIQARFRRSGFVDVTREDVAVRLDALAVAMEARGKLFDTIEARTSSPVEKAQTLIRLAAGGILTEGLLASRARELILGYLSRPGFLSGYMSAQVKDGAAPDSEKMMAELIETLGKAGITPETGLKSIAA